MQRLPIQTFPWEGQHFLGTYFWVDPQEDLVGLLMSQFMVGFDMPAIDLRTLVYQAIEE